jgi:hypothetical protein
VPDASEVECNRAKIASLVMPQPASASQVNAMVSLQYRIERHGVADDLGGSGNLGSGESIRFASCSLMPLSMMSAQLDDAVKIF